MAAGRNNIVVGLVLLATFSRQLELPVLWLHNLDSVINLEQLLTVSHNRNSS